jgi:hypothetical protein
MSASTCFAVSGRGVAFGGAAAAVLATSAVSAMAQPQPSRARPPPHPRIAPKPPTSFSSFLLTRAKPATQ